MGPAALFPLQRKWLSILLKYQASELITALKNFFIELVALPYALKTNWSVRSQRYRNEFSVYLFSSEFGSSLFVKLPEQVAN
jgi:hypothetical protein